MAYGKAYKTRKQTPKKGSEGKKRSNKPKK